MFRHDREIRRVQPRGPESAFTLVEVMVVVLIIMIMAAIGLTSLRGSKHAAAFRAASAAAASYSDAVEAYMADNGQTPPAIGTTSWPASPRTRLLGGPVDVLLLDGSGSPRRYMPQSVPDAVDSGLVDFSPAGAPVTGSPRARITYAVSGATYVLEVETVDSPVLRCVITNGATLPPGRKRCG